MQYYSRTCPDCGGTGYDFGDGGQCDRCDGTGDIDYYLYISKFTPQSCLDWGISIFLSDC